MENPFVRRIREGTITSEDELKVFFRRTAKDVHPDTSPFTQESAAFARLNAHYEDAVVYLRSKIAGETDHFGQADDARDMPAARPHGGLNGFGDRARQGTCPDRSSARDRADQPAASNRKLSPEEGRFNFYVTLQNLLARTYPFTKGKESRDASLERHIQDACKAWDAWQAAEPGLFLRVEILRKEKIADPWGGNVSDQSAWQALENFLFSACHGGMELGPPSPQKKLLEHRAKEALLKLSRREGYQDVCRLVDLLLNDLRTRLKN